MRFLLSGPSQPSDDNSLCPESRKVKLHWLHCGCPLRPNALAVCSASVKYLALQDDYQQVNSGVHRRVESSSQLRHKPLISHHYHTEKKGVSSASSILAVVAARHLEMQFCDTLPG